MIQTNFFKYSDGNPPPSHGSVASFDQYLASSRVVNGATVRCYKHSAAGPWQVVTLIDGVCVQHSSEARYCGHFVAAKPAIDSELATWLQRSTDKD